MDDPVSYDFAFTDWLLEHIIRHYNHGSYQGLFDPAKWDIFPVYYALHPFGALCCLGREVETTVDDELLPLVAATDGERQDPYRQ